MTTPREQLEALGVPTEILDAYQLEVRREAAGILYDADSGTCGCGCYCAQLIDPDQPCPHCDDVGGRQLGEACYVCGHVRTTPPDPPRPSMIPSQLYEGMLAHLLGVQPVQRRPAYTGVLSYLEGGKS